MRPVYFVPATVTIDRFTTARADIHAGAAVESAGVAAGPGGGAGHLLAIHNRHEQPTDAARALASAAQGPGWEWTEARAGEGEGELVYQIGVNLQDPPKPAEIERERPLVKTVVHRLEGLVEADWRLPVAIGENGQQYLPHAHKHENGQIIRRLVPGFEEAAVAAAELQYAFENQLPTSLRRECEIATVALGLVYRVGLPEASALDLLTSRNLLMILSVYAGIYG